MADRGPSRDSHLNGGVILESVFAKLAVVAVSVSWANVAPILYRHCAECHRPGEFAPFSVLQYRDVAQHARSIARAVTTHTMPPWKAAPATDTSRTNAD